MHTIRRLWQSLEILTTALTGLAATVDAFNDHVRQRVEIGTAAEPPLRPLSNGQPEPEPEPLATDQPAALPVGRKHKMR